MITDRKEKMDQHEILVVDDTPASLQLLTKILTDHGYRVRPASNGLLALRSVDAKAPDLILLDVKMPDLDGFEICRRLKADERSRDIPVLFISALGETVEKVKGFEIGGLDYITKPFETEEVLARVKIHLRLSELTARLEQKVHERTDELTNVNLRLEQEVAERKSAEKANLETMSVLKATLESTDNGILVVSEYGKVIHSNRRFAQMWHIPQELIVSSDEKAMLNHVLEQLVDPQNFIRGVETLYANPEAEAFDTLVFKDGRILERASLPMLMSGKLAGRVWSFRDITERKQAEAELQKYHEHLEDLVTKRTAELSAINQELEAFSYSVSHDLRSFLRTINGFSQILIEDYGSQLDEMGNDHLRRIKSACQRMGELIDDLLKLSRISRSELHIEAVDLSQLLQSIANSFQQNQPERHVDIIIPDGVVVQGDKRLLTIALENLLGNAWKFTANEPKGKIEFGITGQDGGVAYFIRDNGVGFDIKDAERLFVPFQRLHSESDYPGTGIGLSTVQRIIHRHGGRIWAEAETGKGATFYFTL